MLSVSLSYEGSLIYGVFRRKSFCFILQMDVSQAYLLNPAKNCFSPFFLFETKTSKPQSQFLKIRQFCTILTFFFPGIWSGDKGRGAKPVIFIS